MDKIDCVVLLSTYNGEVYLKEQLDSILDQNLENIQILIRDDGSLDNTIKVIEAYSDKYNNISFYRGKNCGFVKSFSNLIDEGLRLFPSAEYFSFSDQDDIWYPEKLRTGVETLANYNQSKPCLFSSNSRYVNSNGESLGLLFHGMKYKGSINPSIFPTEQGCSMVFNRTAAKIYSENNPDSAWHDIWMYLICYYLGNVNYCTSPLFDYRIHGNNALGTNKSSSFFQIIKRVDSSSPHVLISKEFLSSFEKSICEDDKRRIVRYIEYKKNIINKVHFIITEKYLFHQCNFMSRLKLIFKILLEKL